MTSNSLINDHSIEFDQSLFLYRIFALKCCIYVFRDYKLSKNQAVDGFNEEENSRRASSMMNVQTGSSKCRLRGLRIESYDPVKVTSYLYGE